MKIGIDLEEAGMQSTIVWIEVTINQLKFIELHQQDTTGSFDTIRDGNANTMKHPSFKFTGVSGSITRWLIQK